MNRNQQQQNQDEQDSQHDPQNTISKQAIQKIILVGDVGVGKTHLLKRYIEGQNPKMQSQTIGAEFATKMVQLKNGKKAKIQFWDTAGQERFKSMTQQLFRDAVGVILCFDLTKESSYENLYKWLEEIKQSQCVADVKVALIGNKLDVCEDRPDQRKISFKEAEQFAKQNSLSYTETSAIQDKNVDQAFGDLINLIEEQKQGKNVDEQILTLKPENEPVNTQPGGCCKC